MSHKSLILGCCSLKGMQATALADLGFTLEWILSAIRTTQLLFR